MRADSLAGRVVAVLSRRTPEFQPLPEERPGLAWNVRLALPNPPSVDDPPTTSSTAVPVDPAWAAAMSFVSIPPAARAAEKLMELDPPARFLGRPVLLEMATSLRLATESGKQFVAEVPDALNGTADIRALLDASARANASAHRLDLALAAARAFAEDLTLALAATQAETDYLTRALVDTLDRSHRLIEGLTAMVATTESRTAGYYVARTVAGYASMVVIVDVARTLVENLALAAERIDGAASDFRGADLSGVALDGRDLSGVLWDTATRWPKGWTERLRRTSGELRPGVFVVLPELSSDFADLEGVGV
jgi:hypothetical protein